MTTAKIADRGFHFVEISWDVPDYEPDHFQLTASCTLICDDTSYVYKNSSVTVPSSATSGFLHNLLPGSVCQVKFLAVYNPSTIDPGIKLTAFTLNTRKIMVNCL